MQLSVRLLLYVVVCANFCSRQGTTAQSGSIKALRSSNLRRDGLISCASKNRSRHSKEPLAACEPQSEYHCSRASLCNSSSIFTAARIESNHLTDLYRKEETISVGGNGCIHSPRFPSSYPRNLLLTWRLLSTENTRIQLAFDNQFGLEEPENDICRYDFVEVEDLSETSTVIRGRWCGHKEIPPRITSKTNQLKITFKSDDYFVAKPGFKIYYSLVGVSYPSPSVTDPTLTAEALDQTIAGFDTVEELLKHFNPESWQEDLENLYTDTGHHYRGRSYRDRKSKVDLDRLNEDVKRYSCTPRNYSVNLREELKLTNVVFFPRCFLVQRCGGNCGCGTVNWRSCTCTAGKTVKKYHEVLKFIPESGHPRRKGRTKNNMALVDIQLEHHERCDCVCSSRPPR
ncbi:platelet-derived growth factor D isoform X4 [Mauremys reevesii]|uniref:platelet-derived growth factor D isoform X4 n=1 Tax=Mauremys reevesii TaxID=260615 RepID=UPI00193FF54C|nr:platelet-derived growth factor D isoform X4 [Mauremys reevesii]